MQLSPTGALPVRLSSSTTEVSSRDPASPVTSRSGPEWSLPDASCRRAARVSSRDAASTVCAPLRPNWASHLQASSRRCRTTVQSRRGPRTGHTGISCRLSEAAAGMTSQFPLGVPVRDGPRSPMCCVSQGPLVPTRRSAVEVRPLPTAHPASTVPATASPKTRCAMTPRRCVLSG